MTELYVTSDITFCGKGLTAIDSGATCSSLQLHIR